VIVYVTKNEVTTFGLNNKLVEFSDKSSYTKFSQFPLSRRPLTDLLSRVIFYMHENTINRSLEFGDVKNEKRGCLSTGLLDTRKRRSGVSESGVSFDF